MAQEQLNQEMEQLTFQLSEKTRVSYGGTLVHFVVFPTEQGSEGIDPTVVSFNTTLWKKIKYEMSRATAQLRDRESGKIKLMCNKYLDIKCLNQDYWQVNIMTYARSGAPIYNACIFLSEDEWMGLVSCEPKLTERIEMIVKRDQAAKRQKMSSVAEKNAHKTGIFYFWTYQDKTSGLRFFSKEHALEHCMSMFPDASNNDICINREAIIPPSVPLFLKFAHLYGQRVSADYLYTHQVDTDHTFDEILKQVEVPHQWLVTAFIQFHLYLGLTVAASKAEPYIACLRDYYPVEKIHAEVKALDITAHSPYSYLCRDLFTPFLPVVTVDD